MNEHVQRAVRRPLIGAAAFGLAAATLVAQTQSRPPAPSAAAEAWSAPRTPWGHPDLQGNYTNKYEQGTPFERPPEFEGRRIEDITGEELRRIVEDRATQVLLNAPFTGGDPESGNFGGAPAFYDRFEANKGSRPWFVIDPPDGRIPRMTPEGQKAAAERAAARAAARRGRGPSDSYTDRSLYDRCITRGLPGSMMPANYGNSYRIVQSPNAVAITYEMVHETRIIPLDGGEHVPGTLRSFMGDARGRWDGDTLVVETTRFRPEPNYRNTNPDALRLVERFTLAGPDRIEWTVTVDDPTTWARPWTFGMPLTRNDDEAVLEYACHEGNRAMENLLLGARAEEAAGSTVAAVRTATASPNSTAGIVLPPPQGDGRLTGTWVLDTVTGGRGANFAGFALATRMSVSHFASELRVVTNTGTTGQPLTTVYRLDGSEHPIPGPIGWDTRARARWSEDQLTVNVTRTVEGPTGPVVFNITDVYRISGDTLILERSAGNRSQANVYRRP